MTTPKERPCIYCGRMDLYGICFMCAYYGPLERHIREQALMAVEEVEKMRARIRELENTLRSVADGSYCSEGFCDAAHDMRETLQKIGVTYP